MNASKAVAELRKLDGKSIMCGMEIDWDKREVKAIYPESMTYANQFHGEFNFRSESGSYVRANRLNLDDSDSVSLPSSSLAILNNLYPSNGCSEGQK